MPWRLVTSMNAKSKIKQLETEAKIKAARPDWTCDQRKNLISEAGVKRAYDISVMGVDYYMSMKAAAHPFGVMMLQALVTGSPLVAKFPALGRNG